MDLAGIYCTAWRRAYLLAPVSIGRFCRENAGENGNLCNQLLARNRLPVQGY